MSTELPEERALGYYRWEYVPLQNAPAYWDDCKSLLDHTTWIVDKLRQCPFNETRDIMYNERDIMRLFRPKMRRNEQEDKWEKTKVDLNDETKALALAHYLFFTPERLILRGGTDCCEQCSNGESSGPGDSCFSGQKHVLGGACFNCVYNGTADMCTFKRAADAGRFLGFTEEILQSASTEDLQDVLERILYEDARRRGLEQNQEEP
ncbi:hypothetical protein E8E14_013069 [Neopestalotiopsis sp. 37M]|nr:hypothetical protein E8E14_013069 [Neopestalotiopsis sp. 37M]